MKEEDYVVVKATSLHNRVIIQVEGARMMHFKDESAAHDWIMHVFGNLNARHISGTDIIEWLR